VSEHKGQEGAAQQPHPSANRQKYRKDQGAVDQVGCGGGPADATAAEQNRDCETRRTASIRR
jgi:hypothetical protein